MARLLGGAIDAYQLVGRFPPGRMHRTHARLAEDEDEMRRSLFTKRGHPWPRILIRCWRMRPAGEGFVSSSCPTMLDSCSTNGFVRLSQKQPGANVSAPMTFPREAISEPRSTSRLKTLHLSSPM